MPQTFDTRPHFAPLRPSQQTPAARAQRTRPDPLTHLTLVADRGPAARTPAKPYSLEGRRHLASVPPPSAQREVAQAAAARADNPAMDRLWISQRLEPTAFALVLLVSVAALAIASRIG